MIPIKLTIEGLYSYQDRQTIDFTELTAGGLFGIFGSTGSGKSSILEAISFVLYGNTERLNSKRGYNMMNLKSNRIYLDFEFINFENKQYRVTKEYKRNSKQFEKIKSPETYFYEWSNEQWGPIEKPNVENIVGLSYDNFKRTIIIPQGQFKEFLNLGDADRSRMLMEIFNLKKFDLQYKVSKLMNSNKSSLDLNKGKLDTYEEVSEEKVITLKNKYAEEKEQTDKAKKTLEGLEKQFQEMTLIKTKIEALAKDKKSFQILEQEKESIAHLEAKTKQYESLRNIFEPLLKRQTEALTESQKQEVLFKKNETELQQVQETIQANNREIESLEPAFQNLEQDKQQEKELELIVKMKGLRVEIDELSGRIEKGNLHVEQERKLKEELEVKQKEKQSQKETLQKQKMDTALIESLSNWYIQAKNIRGQIAKLGKDCKDIQVEIGQKDEALNALSFKEDTYENDFQEKEVRLKQEKQILEDQRSHLLLEEKFLAYQQDLKEGDACPLCGSEHHPNIQSGKDVSKELKEVKEKIKTNQMALDTLQEQKQKIEKLLNEKNHLSSQLQKAEAELSFEQNKLQDHQQTFIWKDFDVKDEQKFHEAKEKSLETEQSLKTLEQELSKISNQLKETQDNLEKYRNAVQDFKSKVDQSQGSFEAHQKDLKKLKFEDFLSVSIEEIQTQSHSLQQKIADVSQKYEAAQQKKQSLQQQLAGLEATIKAVQDHLEEWQGKLKEVLQQIEVALGQTEFSEIESIRNILQEKLDIAANRTRIEQFNVNIKALKQKIQEQEAQLKDTAFDLTGYVETEAQLQTAKEANEYISKQFHQTELELKQNQKALEEKKGLLQEQSKLQNRQDNLNNLFNIFKGSGFVQYVSSIYLRQLCDHANIRFRRMTKNQLSLNLDEANDFEVIDYLNEGRTRSVKTLSGGQAFQASLSLALALAESVQTQNQSKQNFFFIDEGFGTQDIESVNLVFDTLIQLQKENRIVGIISHVDELKERMPRALHIHKDEEQGSKIEMV